MFLIGIEVVNLVLSIIDKTKQNTVYPVYFITPVILIITYVGMIYYNNFYDGISPQFLTLPNAEQTINDRFWATNFFARDKKFLLKKRILLKLA